MWVILRRQFKEFRTNIHTPANQTLLKACDCKVYTTVATNTCTLIVTSFKLTTGSNTMCTSPVLSMSMTAYSLEKMVLSSHMVANVTTIMILTGE